MRVIPLLPIALLVLAACLEDASRCLPGFQYSAPYDACIDQRDAGGDAAAASDAGATASDAGSGSDVSTGDAGTGLGASCKGDGDCKGAASYCLKDPTGSTTDPGVCSIPRCTAADCGSKYACCDCTAGVLEGLRAWPAPVCAPAGNKDDLTAAGCTCP